MTQVKEKIIKGSSSFTIDNNIVTYYDVKGKIIKRLQYNNYEEANSRLDPDSRGKATHINAGGASFLCLG